MVSNPKCYDEAFIFYSKDYRKVKILHYDINGYVMYQKWFDNGKFLKPEFTKEQKSHEISRETLILLLSTVADRAPLYETIVKDLEEYHIVRAACWFHARHKFVNAYISDKRMAQI